MKRLRVVVMAALVVLMAGGLAVAQDRPGRPRRERGERRARRGPMQILDQLQELDLTDEQRAEIEKLQADFRKRTKELQQQVRGKFEELRKFRQENPDDREGLRKKQEEMREQMAPMREATQAFIEEVKGVLNEEQLKKFNELMAQRRGRRGGRMPVGLLGIPPELLEQLELTDEQQEKVRGLLQAFMEEQRQLREKFQGMVKEMLTPEQQDKYEKGLAEARERFRNRMGARRRGERGDRPRRRRGREEAPAE